MDATLFTDVKKLYFSVLISTRHLHFLEKQHLVPYSPQPDLEMQNIEKYL